MAIASSFCTVSKCTTPVTEDTLQSAGLHFLNTRWINAVRAGTTTKCLAHYLDTDIPSVYAAYIKGPDHRGNRDKA
jgi:hypothetical protein